MSGRHHGFLTDLSCWFMLLFDWNTSRIPEDWEADPQDWQPESTTNEVAKSVFTQTVTTEEPELVANHSVEVSYVG